MYALAGILLFLSELCSASDHGGLRVVFQYNGLLEAGPTGGYQRLLEAGPAGGYQRLSEPGRRPGLVTWTPHTEGYKHNKRTKWRTKTENDLKKKPEVTYEDVKFSLITRTPSPPPPPTAPGRKLVTWVPRMSVPTPQPINQPAGGGTQNKESESDTSQVQQDSLARKEVLFEREPAVRPKNVFYNEHKPDRFTELIWTGEKFDPIPLRDVVPTSGYNLVTKNGLYQPSMASPAANFLNNNKLQRRRLKLTTSSPATSTTISTTSTTTVSPEEPFIISILKGFVESSFSPSTTSTTTTSTTTSTTTTSRTTTTSITVPTTTTRLSSSSTPVSTVRENFGNFSDLVFKVFPVRAINQNIKTTISTSLPPIITATTTTTSTTTTTTTITSTTTTELIPANSPAEKTKFLTWLNDEGDDYVPLHQLIKQNKPIIKKFPQVGGLIPTSTSVPPLNLLDWLASKSKLRPSTVRTPAPPVRSVDGDVIKFFQSSQDHYQANHLEEEEDHLYQDQNFLQEDMDMAESSVQVSIPDFLDEDMIIHGDGGVIYVDYDLVTATTSVDVEPDDMFDESEVTEEQLDNVMEHNNKIVGVLQNTLEMQAYLFDKLLSYIF